MPDLSNKIKAIYNEFNGKNLELLEEFYAPKAVFSDPVTTCRGLAEIKRYYAHAYKNVQEINFEFHEIFHAGPVYGAPWTMKLRAKGLNGGQEFSVEGLSHIVFNDKGLVIKQRDYLDLGEMVYERLPVQGSLIRLLKRFMKP